MLILYRLVLNVAYAVLQPYFFLKRKKAVVEWRQRRALDPETYLPAVSLSADEPGPTGMLLFHASSVGEVRVLRKLVEAFLAIRPDTRFCISTYTRTGQKLARELFPEAEAVFFFPLDSYLPLKRFFGRFRPSGIIMVETEIWPYFLHFCRKLQIPLFLANGRISSRSANRYRLFRRSLSVVLRAYKKFIMQTEADAERLIEMGADAGRIIVRGNIKNDIDNSVDPADRRKEVRSGLGMDADRFLFIAASTRPGEEEILCRALVDVSIFPEAMTFLLAPRHLDRLEEVREVLDRHGCAYILYSDLVPDRKPVAPVILMDKMGVLAGLFYGADLAFVGGTLADLGGHNIMEPVLARTPVLFGPSVYTVKEAADRVIEENLGLMVRDAGELAKAIERIASGAIRFETIASGGRSRAQETAEIILAELGP